MLRSVVVLASLLGWLSHSAAGVPVSSASALQPAFYPDVGVCRIIAPASDVDSGDTVFPQAVVGNFGAEPAGFRVMMRFDDTTYLDYESTFVRPGESTAVTFTPWVALRRGLHLAKCSTMLAVDSNPANDAQMETFMVPVYDVGIVALPLPQFPDTGDAVIPLVTIYNYGTGGVSYWITFRIAPDYFAAESSYIDVWQTKQVSFSVPWHVTHRGIWEARCSLDYGHGHSVKSGYVYVSVSDPDVAVIRFLAPPDSAPNKILVAHWSDSSTHEATCSLEIYDSTGTLVYSDVKTFTFQGAGDEIVTFAPWGHLPGRHRLVARADVPGDSTPEEDVLEQWWVSGIQESPELQPRQPEPFLLVAAPNPFRDRCAIRYALPAGGRARLQVLDPAGRLVRTLSDGAKAAGGQNVTWDGRDESGRATRSGIYICRLEAGARAASVEFVRMAK